jgi:hypothetical protein
MSSKGEKDPTIQPERASEGVKEGGVGHNKPRYACFEKLISLPALHTELFVSRLLSVPYNSHIQEERNWPNQ